MKGDANKNTTIHFSVIWEHRLTNTFNDSNNIKKEKKVFSVMHDLKNIIMITNALPQEEFFQENHSTQFWLFRCRL